MHLSIGTSSVACGNNPHWVCTYHEGDSYSETTLELAIVLFIQTALSVSLKWQEKLFQNLQLIRMPTKLLSFLFDPWELWRQYNLIAT